MTPLWCLCRGARPVALVVALIPGCSWLFVQPLPSDYRGAGPVTCTTSKAAPVLDTIFVGTNVSSVIYVAGKDDVKNKGSAIGLGLSVAALWALSAHYGYTKTNECAEATTEGGYERYPRPRGYVPVVSSVPPAPRPVPAAGAVTAGIDGGAPANAAGVDGGIAPAQVTPAPPAASQAVDEEDPSQRRRRPAPPPMFEN